MNRLAHLRAAAFAGSLVLFSQPLSAQTAAPVDQAEGETLKLSPFMVSTDKDNGYIAADTISSGRLSTNLLKTPSDTTVLTRDFLNDIGAFSIDEAAAWLTSSRPLELGAIEGNSLNAATFDFRDNGSNISMRGLTTQPGTRNYFPSATTPMEYNVERVEGARGPNAILYGEGGPGGTVNYLTKRAKSYDFTTVRARADNFGSYGGAVDVNRTISKQLATRFNLSTMEGRSYLDHVENNHLGGALSVVYSPLPDTSITLDVDASHTYRSGQINAYLDIASNWNKVPVVAPIPTAAAATAAGLTLLGNNVTHAYTYIEGLNIVDLKGWGQTSGTAIPLVPGLDRGIPNFPTLSDREFNTNPEEVNIQADVFDVQLAAQHQFGSGLVVELAGAFGRIEQDGSSVRFDNVSIDPNQKLPNGQNNPNYGKVFSGSIWGRNVDGSMRENRAVRLASNYPFKIFGGVQNFSIIAQHTEQDSLVKQGQLRIVDNPSTTNPITGNGNIITVWRYWDNLPRNLPDFSKFYTLRNVLDQYSLTERTNDSVQLGTYGSYFDDSLSIVGGFRREKSDLHTSNGVAATRDPVSGDFTAYTLADRLAYNNSFSAGVVYFPIKVLGAYVNYSEGFTIQTNANPKIDGSFADVNIVPSSSKTAGLRANFLGGKIVGSAGYYQVEETNSYFTLGVTNFNTIWRNHNLPDRVIPTFTSAESITDTRSLKGWGWEGEVTANLSNALRLTANIAFPETKQSGVGADFVNYWTDHQAEFEQLAALSTNSPAIAASDALQIANIKNVISGFAEGRVQNQTYKYRLNVFGNYTIQSTVLKGVRLGLGAQYYGKRLIGNAVTNSFDYIYDKPYNLVNASIARTFKLKGKLALDVQLNVTNAFDYDDPLVNGTFNRNGVSIPYGYKYAIPRSIRLTTTLRF